MKKKTLFIIFGVFLGLILVLSLILLLYSRASDDIADSQKVEGQIVNEGAIDEEKVMRDIDFIHDFPLPGGEVVMFEEVDNQIVLQIVTVSTAEESYNWLRRNLEDTEWNIEESDLSDHNGYMTVKSYDAEVEITIVGEEGARTAIKFDFLALSPFGR